MLPYVKRRSVRALLHQGYSLRAISRLTGVSLSSVRRIARDGEPLPDARERQRRRVGRPAKTARFASMVRRLLERHPDLTTARILDLAKSAGYSGQKSAMYELVAKVRRELGAPSRPVVQGKITPSCPPLGPRSLRSADSGSAGRLPRRYPAGRAGDLVPASPSQEGPG